MNPNRFAMTRLALTFAVLGAPALAGQAGLGILPGREEVQMTAGSERTVSFEVEAPASDNPVRGRLLLSTTDWTVTPEARLVYADPNTLPNSAASWITFSPAAFSITSGQKQLVRVTLRVPEGTPDGVHRAGIFIQERPPATPPKTGEHQLVLRFRYVYILYVMVGSLRGLGDLAEIGLVSDRTGVRVPVKMLNKGTKQVRPLVQLTIRDLARDSEVFSNLYEALVLLPAATQTEAFPLPNPLNPGKYEIQAQVDFQDGGALKIVKRIVEVAEAPLAAEPAGEARNNRQVN